MFSADFKPTEAVISVSGVALHEILGESMYVGFSSRTYSTNVETHRVSSWNFNSTFEVSPSPPLPSLLPPPLSPPQSHSKSKAAAQFGSILGAVIGSVLVGVLLFCWFKHRNKFRSLAPLIKPPEPSTTDLTVTDTHALAYTFKELSIITKNFGDSELLSSGAFGDVYKGTPPSGGKLLAVKRIKENKAHAHVTSLAEANSLSQVRHRHLLQLRGWCEAKEGMFLVYDFMSNGSLDMWLHPDPSQVSASYEGLPWNVRRTILAGVASG